VKVLIINPPIRLHDKPRHIPHGLAIIASVIRERLDITPRFLDMNALRLTPKEALKKLSEEEFDVVLTGGLIPVYRHIIWIAEAAKKINPGALVIAGGSAGMSVPRLLLENSLVDAVCAGEGEAAIVELLLALSKGGLKGALGVKGFYFKKDGKIHSSGPRELLCDLDRESALPAYDLLPMDIYLSNPIIGFGKDIDFISSRGCPYKCTFCYQPWGRKFRGHSVEFIMDALKRLKERYSIDFVSFQDDEFMADRSRVREFCSRVKDELPGLLWSCTGRVNLVSEELLGMMREAGCVSVSYGFESGSPRMLKSMKKDVTIEAMERAVALNRRFGMMLPVSFIIGMPGEDDGSCGETVEFCVRNSLPLKSLMFATPYPGTALFEQALASGRIDQAALHSFVSSLGDARDFVVNLTDAFSDGELMEKRQEMIDQVCSRVRPLDEREYEGKIKGLFGDLAAGYLKDSSTVKHRATHGGIDLF